MKFTAKTVLSLLLVLSFFAFTACTGKPEYKTDVSVADLSAKALAVIEKRDNLTDASGEFLYFFLSLDENTYSEFSVKTPLGSASIDEFGIFKATSEESAEDIEAKLTAYLQGRVQSWDTRYDQSEKGKVDGAKVMRFGSYVTYAILSSSEQEAFFNTVKDALTQK